MDGGNVTSLNEPITARLDPRASLSPRLKDTGVAARSPVPTGEPTCGDGNHRSVRSPSVYPVKGRGRPGVERRSHSPARSSDSLPSHHSQAQRKKDTRQKKVKGSRSSRKHHRRRARNRHQSSSRSPARRSRHADGGRKCQSHGTRQRSSPGSCSRSASRERESQTKSPHSRQNSTSQTKSPHSRQNSTREKDSDGRTPHTDTEGRAHQRSRSYSPIRKRRSDSPSFMEARRITSARKRPIPYYRPSPSSPSSLSSCSAVRRYSRSRSRSRSWSSRSPSRNHSYYSRGSSESLAF
ncbi:hypothetical protein SKAU_G00083960 [Synaphobranchus kaupii]|uniref:Serine/arginine repetitive matrix protein C-terminal domain-containing protein n=1 Tax=Synaphobranchus kaupii TaxID=118154 RepID=A0A9Q1FW78_SYNKA|nr:hypothetical protein SKAU_G00083960 [Synaphobranchus kaupii]